MKSKVISLFGNNGGVKYSDLLKDFIKPFENNFPKDYEFEDIIEFSIHTWNFANINKIMPPEEFEELTSSPDMSARENDLFQNMLEFKEEKFREYDQYILDYEIEEEGNAEVKITVETADAEEFIESIKDDFDRETLQEDHDENYINRYAIVLKPLQPLMDWINNLDPEHKITEIDEANVYLVDDDIGDLEVWLRKKFDKFFKLELEEWVTDKKEWPQKRNYKMFKQWFQIDISSMVYDMEKRPIFKG